MADPNEEAARRIQEQLWMQDAAEAANDDDDAEEEGGGDDDNHAGNVNDFVRQLLDQDGDGEDDDDDEAADDNRDAEEEDHDDDDEDEDLAERRRGAVDGGIAGEVRDEHGVKLTRSLKCPLVLYFETDDDDMEALSPGNPILKRGTTVYIGLDKTTKLSVVFHRYCAFVNSKNPKKAQQAKKGVTSGDVKLSDLEFVHCALLDPNLDVPSSAMMKNDRIRVSKERGKERQAKAEVLRQQRESDRKYFKDLRQLLPNPSPEGMGCDVVLDCQGRVVDGRGFSQNVLATAVRANSVLISKRCKWLGQKIRDAREAIQRTRDMTVEDDNEEKSGYEDEEGGEGEESSGLKSGQSDDEEEIIMAEEPAGMRREEEGEGNNQGGQGSHKVEDTEDEDTPTKRPRVKVARRGRGGNDAEPHSRNPKQPAGSSPNSVWVTLDHSPQAVKLLLEYCYTNRVVALGQEAFVRASNFPNPKDVGALAAKQAGPVPPFRKHEWPEGGAPTVSLHLALAGVALAEEAHMPRLSLMCEIAASQLVDANNVIDVLGACHIQQSKTGNRLPILRKAALLDCIMANGSRGIDDLYATGSAFKTGLEERCGLVVPSLLDGTVEVMPANMQTKDIKKKKDRMASDRRRHFESQDLKDKNLRTMERIKHRDAKTVRKREEAAFGPDERGLNRYAAAAAAKGIWRESAQRGAPRRDPPPMNAGGVGRGTKRKKKAADSGGAGAAAGEARNVRRRASRRRNA